MRASALLLLVAASCGEPGMVSEDRGLDANQIARLSTPKAPPDPRPASVRLEPLDFAALDGAGMPDPDCEFLSGGRVLVAATSGDAVARIGGRILHFTHSSPASETGGFFEDRQLSISVGRIADAAPLDGGWPARIRVTNRPLEVQAEASGIWRCGAPLGPIAPVP